MNYRQLIDDVQEGIWAIDVKAKTSLVNSHMAEMLGYTVEEMLGKPIFSFMDKKGAVLCKGIFENLERRKQGTTEQHEFEFHHKNGSYVYTNVSLSPIVDDSGNHEGTLACVIDRTERKKTEEAYKLAEEKYRKLVEHSVDCIHTIDTNGRFVHINKTGLRLNCLNHEREILGKSYQKMVHKKYENVVVKAIQKALKGEAASFHYETTTPKGDHKWWDSNLVPICSADGKIVHMVGISGSARLIMSESVFH